MFWHAVWSGFLALFDWHILLGLAVMGLLTFGYHLITVGLGGDGKSSGRLGAAFGWQLLGGPLIMIVAIPGFITLCLPAILGIGGFTPGPAIGAAWPEVLMASFIAFSIMMGVTFIPVVGSVIAYTPGAGTYIMGAIVLQRIVEIGYRAISGHSIDVERISPSLWQAIGFLIIGAAIGLGIGVAIASALEGAVHDRDWLNRSGASGNTPEAKLVAKVLNPLSGVLPLLMYGRYLGASLERLF